MMNNRLLIASMVLALVAFVAAGALAQTLTSPAPTAAPAASPAATPAATPAGTHQTQDATPTPPPKNETKAEGNGPNATTNKSGGDNPMDWKLLALLGGVMVLMLFWSSRNRKKQDAKRREQLASIKKGDTITSIGGIIGTVVEVREKELIIKIDDGTRMHLARWAVRGVGENSMTDETEKK